MKKAIFLLLAIWIVSAGCSTYVYHGTIEEPDSDGVTRKHQIWWSVTERKLWFDEVEEGIRLREACSNRPVYFKETEDGIIFICTPQDEGAFNEIGVNGSCGSILDYLKVKDIPEGPLKLQVICVPKPNEMAVGIHAYLKAREMPYTFIIKRDKKEKFPDGAPKPPKCPDSD